MESYVAKGRPVRSLRLGSPEHQIIAEAAAKRGEAVSTYIRRVALECARRELAKKQAAR